METIYIGEIESKFILNRNAMGSECKIYNGIINGKAYTFKKFYFSNEYLDKLDSLSNTRNKYIIQPQILVKDDNNLNRGYLTETFCNSKTFFDLSSSGYSISKKIKVLRNFKRAILEMHSLGIIHVDLHPANILFRNNSVKICDFDSCKYLSFEPTDYNGYSKEYIVKNGLSPSVDIYNFNIDLISILYNINWYDIFKFDFIFEDKLNSEQKRIWQKVKTQEPLTNKDFLINHY